jgi:DNA (cytosine-5)-methyltransferase 1
MRALDFFCGAGGLTRGLLNAGIRVIAGFDIDKRCKLTYESNNRPAIFYEKNVANIDTKVIWNILGTRRTSDLLLAGCAPCQPFSKHQKGKPEEEDDGFADFERDAKLLGAFARLVEEIQPGQVLVENVPGLTRVRGFSTYRRFVRMLGALNYHVAEGILDAKHFGVPQSRRRYVLIALRSRGASLPERQYGPGLRAYTTVRDFISHYPPIAAGERHKQIPNHEAASISDLNKTRLSNTPHDGGDRRSWPARLRLDCHKGKHDGHSDVYGRMAWDKPAPTLTGKCHRISNGRYGHPCQDRAISFREAASLQTFGDSYVFHSNNQHVARMIGNAVPVKFAEHLAEHILSLRYGGDGKTA